MDIGYKEETYEYYRAKELKKKEEPLSKESWLEMKERKRRQLIENAGNE
jgi:hypothetical protein